MIGISLFPEEEDYKAAKLAELTRYLHISVVADDAQMLEMALVENIQREELDPIEIAIGFQILIEECNLTMML